jgi:hypothetical protein
MWGAAISYTASRVPTLTTSNCRSRIPGETSDQFPAQCSFLPACARSFVVSPTYEHVCVLIYIGMQSDMEVDLCILSFAVRIILSAPHSWCFAAIDANSTREQFASQS